MYCYISLKTRLHTGRETERKREVKKNSVCMLIHYPNIEYSTTIHYRHNELYWERTSFKYSSCSIIISFRPFSRKIEHYLLTWEIEKSKKSERGLKWKIWLNETINWKKRLSASAYEHTKLFSYSITYIVRNILHVTRRIWVKTPGFTGLK